MICRVVSQSAAVRQIGLAFLLAVSAPPALAQHPAPAAPASEAAQPERRAPDLPKESLTNHMIELPGRMLSFKAAVGPVRLVDARTGAPSACCLFSSAASAVNEKGPD